MPTGYTHWAFVAPFHREGRGLKRNVLWLLTDLHGMRFPIQLPFAMLTWWLGRL